MKIKDTMRAQFLLSPYNIREAKRVREWKNMLIGVGFIIVVLLAVAGFMSFWNR